jgi:DNA repair protein RadC
MLPAPIFTLRPREHIHALGTDEASDVELLAAVLGTGVRGKSALELGRELLADTGGLSALGRAQPRDLVRHPGIGHANAARLAAAFELGRRLVAREAPRSPELRTPRDVPDHVWPRLAGATHEVFLMLALDAANGVIADIEIARGSLTGVEVHPREVFRPLICVGAAACVAVHNHPTGDPTPSAEDIALTERLRTVGALLGIPLTDHVIVAETGHASITEWLQSA